LRKPFIGGYTIIRQAGRKAGRQAGRLAGWQAEVSGVLAGRLRDQKG
jgi:hypothetical protein